MKLVIPNKGVLYEPTLRLLEAAGVSVGRNGNGGRFETVRGVGYRFVA